MSSFRKLRASSGGSAVSVCPLVPMDPQQVDSPMFREASRTSSDWTSAVAARVKQLTKQLAQLKELEHSAAQARKQLLCGLDELAFKLLRDSSVKGAVGETLATAVSGMTSTLADIESQRISTMDTLLVKMSVHMQDFVGGAVQEALDSYKAYQKSIAQFEAFATKVIKTPKAVRTQAMDTELESARTAHISRAVDTASRLNAVTVCCAFLATTRRHIFSPL